MKGLVVGEGVKIFVIKIILFYPPDVVVTLDLFSQYLYSLRGSLKTIHLIPSGWLLLSSVFQVPPRGSGEFVRPRFLRIF